MVNTKQDWYWNSIDCIKIHLAFLSCDIHSCDFYLNNRQHLVAIKTNFTHGILPKLKIILHWRDDFSS